MKQSRKRNENKDGPSFGRIFIIGEWYSLAGFPTIVEIIGKPFARYPECRVVKASRESKYKVGDIIRFPHALLYSSVSRTTKKKRRHEMTKK